MPSKSSVSNGSGSNGKSSSTKQAQLVSRILASRMDRFKLTSSKNSMGKHTYKTSEVYDEINVKKKIKEHLYSPLHVDEEEEEEEDNIDEENDDDLAKHRQAAQIFQKNSKKAKLNYKYQPKQQEFYKPSRDETSISNKNTVIADSFDLINRKLARSKSGAGEAKPNESLHPIGMLKQNSGVEVELKAASGNNVDEYEYAASQKSINLNSNRGEDDENYDDGDLCDQEHYQYDDNLADDDDEDEDENEEEEEEEEDYDEDEACCAQNCKCNANRNYDEQEYEYDYDYGEGIEMGDENQDEYEDYEYNEQCENEYDDVDYDENETRAATAHQEDVKKDDLDVSVENVNASQVDEEKCKTAIRSEDEVGKSESKSSIGVDKAKLVSSSKVIVANDVKSNSNEDENENENENSITCTSF